MPPAVGGEVCGMVREVDVVMDTVVLVVGINWDEGTF